MKKDTGGKETMAEGQSKLWAFIGYLGILCLLPLLLKKDDAFAHFHAKQGLVLFLTGVILSIIMVIPILGWIVGAVGTLVLLVLWIIGLINALTGKQKALPLIGGFAEKLSL